MQPHDGRVVTGVAERLEFVIPCRTERDLQFALHVMDIARRELHRIANAVLPHDDVTRGIRLSVMDAEVGRVHPSGAV